MPEPTYPPEFEADLRKALEVPEPDAARLAALRAQFITQAVAALKTGPRLEPGSAPTQPAKEPAMTHKTSRFSPRLAWGLALLALAVLLALLFTSPTLVTALRRLFGYLPEVGVVEPGPALRVLEKPVTLEHQKIALTVAQVAASLDKTVIALRYEMLQLDPAPEQPAASPNSDRPTLLLPDGSKLPVRVGQRVAAKKVGQISYLLEFPPLAAGVMDITLVMPELPGIPPGLGLNWSIPLKLKPAPAGTVLPIIAVTPAQPGTGFETTATPLPAAQATQTDPLHAIRISLDTFVPLADGYLLTGSLQWDEQDFPAATVMDASSLGVKPNPDALRVFDANNVEIPAERVYAPRIPLDEAYRSYWGLKLPGKNLHGPLTIILDSVDVQLHPLSFSINAGPNPVAGQVLELSQDLQIANSTVHIQKAQFNKDADQGFWSISFDLQVDPTRIADVNLVLTGNQCMSGMSVDPFEHLSLLHSFVPSCLPTLPPDPLQIQATSANLWGHWQVTWTPPG